MLDEIVDSFSTKYYKGDRKIRNTISEVIKTIVKTGNVIVIGRGGVAFSKYNKQSIHIKLTAPFDWRVSRIMKSYQLEKKEAENYVVKVDQERKQLIENFLGNTYDPSIFDLIINRKTVQQNEIIQIILHLLKSRKII